MRILISAYACEPGKGSEPEVGLRIALAAASEHEVWVITRENNLPPLEAYLQNHPMRQQIHLLGFEAGGVAKRLKKRGGLLTLHWYYDVWQRRLADLAIRLDGEVDFDLVHHATFASYWTRTGVAAVNKPLVWGPVGGGVRPPLRLIPVMGFKGALGDLARIAARPVVAFLVGSRQTAKRAQVALVQNRETGALVRSRPPRTRVLPNALTVAASMQEHARSHSVGRATAPPILITAGRLIGLKAPTLAVMAMRYVKHPTAELHIYGEGPQDKLLDRCIVRLSLAHRVQRKGAVARSELLKALAYASVLVHPALHDESPLVVAEALATGVPVVFLDRGGSPTLAELFPETPSRSVPTSTSDATARALARAIDDLIGIRGTSIRNREDHFRKGLLDAYHTAASCASL